MAFDWLEARLSERAQRGYLRKRVCQQYEKDNIICIDGEHYLNFASNDYLGMRQHEGVLQSWVEGLAQFGGGSGASPLVTGHTQAHLALEAYIADGLNRDAALLFNSGFAANQALCMALFSGAHNQSASNKSASNQTPSAAAGIKHSGEIFADRLMHASFLEGAMATKAKLRRFRHNDLAHLSNLLEKVDTTSNSDKLVVTEGVFSMDGDSAPLRDMAGIAKQNKAWLMVDDAHGMGVLGENGLGSVEAQALSQTDVPIVMGTFGKAVGTAGAFIAGSQALIDYLVNFAKHYVYSTAMPPAQAVATLYSLTHIAADSSRTDALNHNIAYFRERFSTQIGSARCSNDDSEDENGHILKASSNNASSIKASSIKASSNTHHDLVLANSHSAIQPIIVGSPERALALSDGLKSRGIWIPAIRYPTVPKGEDRLRITLSATHTQQDIDVLVDAIALAMESIS
ncbi:aminotransferase class I/II-fold pyridoxal phosphate-dependent enzyme [Alteromonas naphthalenivorans]|jgi:8-amino-7-oxononanoate synthase|uniref:8-amino-7-oxononanoate synthase n=1 Tax=Alteromonas naphthalenivorans TaxID=715451 RepID=F5ZDC4_ALTNA|nr:8-amino-7-oxononanoate synthase [Alteromonas naphthalenivorans]AEF03886.1 8-amino-7-oxononanoate synthase [Alteromonas naphthalenivorans]